VRVEVVGDEVRIEGSADALVALASFFDFDDREGLPSHRHFEYFEGNDAWVHSDSVPLVVSAEGAA
jgi:hypothetical protein